MIDRRLVLEGHGVRLEPLGPQHLDGLRASCHDPRLWELTFGDDPFGAEARSQAWLEAALADPRCVPFVIVDAESAATIGSTRYFDIDPAHRKLEIGWTFIATPYWRSHVNTACKLLLLHYAFERWNALRVQFKAEAKNARSRAALERIGATLEGVHRNYRVRPDGEQRDTSFYSIIAPEWPSIRAKLALALKAV